MPDWLALVGDSADGYPGIARWGEKSASTVLARYKHLEAIPASSADWDVKVRGAEALAATLAAQRADALLYRRLATLRTDVPLEESLADLRWRGPDTPALEALAARWRDDAIVARAVARAQR
jgi:5'-3' exonuclease